MPEPTTLYTDRRLSNVSIKYTNEELIAALCMPFVKVPKLSGLFVKYDKDERFTLPDDRIGPKSVANEIDFSVSDGTYAVKDRGLSEFVSIQEEDNQDAPLSVRTDATEFLTELLLLAYEKRVADVVFAQATYPAANRVQLSGTGQWGGSADDPIGDIMTGLDTAFLRPNKMVFGADAWRTFRKLPEILDAVKGATRSQTAGGGVASRADIAALFEVDQVLVGRGRYNSAKKGQTATYVRLWAKHCALLHVKPRPTIRSVTFGSTFHEMNRMTQVIPEPKRGTKGGNLIKITWNTDENVVASDLGYYVEDAVA